VRGLEGREVEEKGEEEGKEGGLDVEVSLHINTFDKNYKYPRMSGCSFFL